ncbi:NERD domain-containing protein/DEAD/DEAH box helicase [Marihabitans asiaticum]|nr:NERD domain-containing protein/DEAD/DEAH box helicase [Marihabitans asiaticum]
MTGPTLLPPDPNFAHASEETVWRALVDQVPEHWTIIAGQHLADGEREYEIDLLVLIPDHAIVSLEVKGGSVWVEDGQWRQASREGDLVIDPVRQAEVGKYAARRYVEGDPRWSRGRVHWSQGVVLASSAVAQDFSLPDLPRRLVHGRDDIDALAGRLADAARANVDGHRAPTQEDCDLVAEILRGRALPLRDVVAMAAERDESTTRLTAEQAMLLKVTRLLNRVEVRGGAGSGKTMLALTQARVLARGADGRPRQRVALLCNSIGLASYFKRELAGERYNRRPALVGTFEELAAHLGVTEFGTRQDTDFWEVELPRRMGELAAELPDGKKFDAIIVDEAQDFADSWWVPLLRSLVDEETGGLHVYSDENQRVFPRFGRPPVQLVPLVLDHNLRNTQQIADVFSPLAPMRMRAMGGDGPEVTFVPTPAGEDPVDAADSCVDELLDEGWRPEDVARRASGTRCRSTCRRAKGRRGTGTPSGTRSPSSTGTFSGARGSSGARSCCASTTPAPTTGRRRSSTSGCRGRPTGSVVGNPELITAMGGPDVARRLRIG